MFATFSSSQWGKASMDLDVVEEIDGIWMRPIPLRRASWASVPWISEDGVLRIRWYNARLALWVWESRPRTPVLDKTGRVGHRLHKQFRTIAQLIALAWLPRTHPMRRMRTVELVAPSNGLVAYNLRYIDADEEETATSSDDDDDEEWLDLECKVGIVPCSGMNVSISNRGRVRVHRTIIPTAGGIGDCFCILPSVPPIPISRVTAALFSSRPVRGDKPPPRIRQVVTLLREGANGQTLQKRLRIKPSTAWSYVHEALRFVSTKSATLYMRQMMQDAHVEAPFRKLIDEAPNLLHAPLRVIVDIFTRTCMASDPMWRTNAHRYAEVCAMRSLLQRE